MSIPKITAIFFTIFFVFGIATSDSAEMGKTVPQIIKEAKSQIPEVTVEEIRSDIDAGKNFVLLDVRTSEEYNAGHLPNSINIRRG